MNEHEPTERMDLTKRISTTEYRLKLSQATTLTKILLRKTFKLQKI